MGLLEDFNIDMKDIKANSGFEITATGFWNFTIGAAFIKEGSVANPDKSWIIIEYILDNEDGETDKYSDLFELPKDSRDLTKKELQTMGFYKARMLELGFHEDEINDIEGEELVGMTGTLEVYHTRGKGDNSDKTYANVRHVKVSTDEETTTFDEPDPEPAAKAPRSRGAAATTDESDRPRRRR
jgi:hypothetical protein